VRLYDRLFSVENPLGDKEVSFLDHVNPTSLEVVPGAMLEPSLAERPAGDRVQFERIGYFCKDPDSTPGAPVYNRTIGLKDSWAKVAEPAPSGKAAKPTPAARAQGGPSCAPRGPPASRASRASSSSPSWPSAARRTTRRRRR